MRKYTLLLALVGMTFGSVQAQTETQTLFGNGKVKTWGILLNSQVQYAEVLGESVFFSNVKGGFVFNEKWLVGVNVGQSLHEIPRYNDLTMMTENLEFTQGGLHLEYRLFPHKLVHVSIPISVGVLQTESEQDNFSPWGNYEDDREYTNFYLEPGLNIELNVSKFIKFQVGASYRFNDAMIAPQSFNSNLKINHHPMFNAGITLGIDNLPKAAKQLKQALIKK
jgi:hypothetical protein